MERGSQGINHRAFLDNKRLAIHGTNFQAKKGLLLLACVLSNPEPYFE
jgi:hypothetical protein